MARITAFTSDDPVHASNQLARTEGLEQEFYVLKSGTLAVKLILPVGTKDKDGNS